MRRINLVIVIIASIFITACASVGSSVSNTLSNAILNNNDLDMVEAGMPAYILLIDGLAQQNPDNATFALASSTLYGAFGALFPDSPERTKLLADKAFYYAQAGACQNIKSLCDVRKMPFDQFKANVEATKKKHLDSIYALGTAWIGWIQANSDDWNAVADIAKVRVIMEHVVTLDENHDQGGAYLYLGGLETFLPPALGGKPEIGKAHFEKAIELSEGKNLLAKVTFAELYARLVFDRSLHDQLLNEVLEQPANVPGLTLLNTFAKKRAQSLLASADDYF